MEKEMQVATELVAIAEERLRRILDTWESGGVVFRFADALTVFHDMDGVAYGFYLLRHGVDYFIRFNGADSFAVNDGVAIPLKDSFVNLAIELVKLSTGVDISTYEYHSEDFI